MSQFPESRRIPLEYGTAEVSVAGFFNAVYAWMAVGLAVTAAVGWYVSQTPAMMKLIFGSNIGYIALALGAFAIAIGVQSAALRISATAGTILFLVYAAIIGALISYVFWAYSPKVLVSAFVLTAGTFGVMSVYGYITKRDLSRIGSILQMAILGLFIASAVNIWLANDPLSWIITYGVLLAVIGLTAYYTQMLKNMAHAHANNPEMAARYAIVGSLLLYISFINMFLSILRIIGGRK